MAVPESPCPRCSHPTPIDAASCPECGLTFESTAEQPASTAAPAVYRPALADEKPPMPASRKAGLAVVGLLLAFGIYRFIHPTPFPAEKISSIKKGESIEKVREDLGRPDQIIPVSDGNMLLVYWANNDDSIAIAYKDGKVTDITHRPHH